MPTRLTADELDHALGYLEAVGVSDFFPMPFELGAIRHSWNSIRPLLEALDVERHAVSPAERMIAPKHNYTVRPIQLLDPIDAIVYVALVFRLSGAIQTKRDQYQAGMVFSNAFNPAGLPTDRAIDSDWDSHQLARDQLSGGARSVATADIADFFPRIYLHRLENALEAESGDRPATAALMKLLSGWSAGTSYGIPTGPRPSFLLGEALLIEVDKFLISRGVQFIRFVDDYTLFCGSEPEALESLYELGDRLLSSEGLTLNMAKTRVWPQEGFRAFRVEPRSPDDEVREQIIATVFEGNIYADVDYDRLEDFQRQFVDEADVRSWVETALAGEPADLRTIKFVLNFLSALRRPELIDPVLDNLSRLSPVSEAVARFLGMLDDLEYADRERVGRHLLDYITANPHCPAYQVTWLLEPFTNSEAWNCLLELRRIARESRSPLIRRQAILSLGATRDRSALLDAKLGFDGSRDWEARAIVFACRHLPEDEREAFYRSIRVPRQWDIANALMKATIEYSRVAD